MTRSAAGTPFHISARDGFALAATRHGAADAPRGLVLLVPATGVLRRLYDPFAAFLASGGFTAVSWDWRGTGGSRPSSLRGFRATMSDWAALDLAGVLEWAATEAAGRPLVTIGHSFGGQSLGLVADPGIATAVTVAAQSGYWGHWPRPQRYLYAGLWKLLFPALISFYGYFPSHLLGLGEDLPAGVGRQWARWCSSPDYLGDWKGHARFTAPILALSFADDTFAPLAAVEALHRRYTAAAVRYRHVLPREIGAKRIGHFGFFKPGTPSLWREVNDWLPV